MSAIQKVVYLMGFEFFPIDEQVFREKVAKELKQYEIYKALIES